MTEGINFADVLELLFVVVSVGLTCIGLTFAYVIASLLIETVRERRTEARCVRIVQQRALGVRERITGEAIAERRR